MIDSAAMSASEPHPEQQPVHPDQQAAPPRMTVNVYRYNNMVQGQWVGGAPDVPSACSLAAAWLTAAQQLYPTKNTGVGIVDATLALVAYIGWQPPP